MTFYMKGRIAVLDVFRGLASFMVMVYHLTPGFYIGRFGVQLFFIISGFVIFMTLDKTSSVTEFFKKRFYRLFPTFWVCVTLTTLVLMVGHVKDKIPSLKIYALNMTMAPEVFHVRSIDGVYWSLLTEMAFYLLMGIILFLRLKKHVVYWGLAWLLLITLNYWFHLDTHVPLLKLLNVRHGQLFLSGILFYKLYTGERNPFFLPMIFYSFGLSLLIYSRQFPMVPVLVSITTIFIVFFLFLYHRLDFLARNKTLLFLGSISYPFYLLHQEIGKTLSIHVNLPPVYFQLLYIPIIVFLSWIVHKYVEKKSADLPALFQRVFSINK